MNPGYHNPPPNAPHGYAPPYSQPPNARPRRPKSNRGYVVAGVLLLFCVLSGVGASVLFSRAFSGMGNAMGDMVDGVALMQRSQFPTPGRQRVQISQAGEYKLFALADPDGTTGSLDRRLSCQVQDSAGKKFRCTTSAWRKVCSCKISNFAPCTRSRPQNPALTRLPRRARTRL